MYGTGTLYRSTVSWSTRFRKSSLGLPHTHFVGKYEHFLGAFCTIQCGTFAGEGPYAVAKQRFLTEEYEKIIPACQQEIDAQRPNALRAQARSKAQPPNRLLPVRYLGI